jgi:nucleoid DNA-binding protein
MNKDQFLKKSAQLAGLPVDVMRKAIAAASVVTAEALATDDVVRVPGLVTFRAKHHAERPARNPKTGVPCVIPAGVRIAAKPTTALLAGVSRAVPTETD